MKHMLNLKVISSVLLCVLFSTVVGCKPRPQGATVGGATTNNFYLMGLAEGHRHFKERPETSLMVFPKESTNWSKQSLDLYRSGYLAGLRSE